MSLSRRSLVASAAALAVPAIAASPRRYAFDKAGMVRRAEESLRSFGTCYVRPGWHESFDTARAAEFLRCVRAFDMHVENEENQWTMHEWVVDHGVSFDWLITGDPVSMICRLAHLSAA
jgi:hypothetical protein